MHWNAITVASCHIFRIAAHEFVDFGLADKPKGTWHVSRRDPSRPGRRHAATSYGRCADLGVERDLELHPEANGNRRSACRGLESKGHSK